MTRSASRNAHRVYLGEGSSRRNYRLKALACFIMGLSVFFTPPCRAWEADIHRGLTEWLALQVGFSPKGAREIAEANQRQDEISNRDAVQLVVRRIITGTRQEAIEASKAVQRFHFPSDADIPGDPKSREVKPNNTIARSRVDKASDLQTLGEALHAYQDTWSHQGIPSIPIGFPQIKKDLSWGHPEARGSWFRHRADLTPKNERDAIETAQATYDRLSEYLGRHKNLKIREPEPWPNLLPKVEEFVKAGTQAEKQAWFEKYAPSMGPSFSFLLHINLPKGPFRSLGTPSGPLFRTAFASLRLQQPSNSDDPQEIAKTFLEAWIVHPEGNKDLSKALNMIDLQSVQKQLYEWDTIERNPRRWASRFLTLWLLEDHGMIESLGHGYPGEPGYEELPIDIASFGVTIRHFTALSQAIRAAGERDTAFDIVDLEKAEFDLPSNLPAFGIAFRFLDLPYDALLVIMGKVAGEHDKPSWKVVRLLWAAI